MKHKFLLFAAILLASASLFSCSKKEEAPGSEGNPIAFYFTPSVDAQTITESSDDLTAFLEKETGLKFKTGVPTNYITVVEAFGSKRADVAIMNSSGYLLAYTKHGAEARLRVIRNGMRTYQGAIYAATSAGVDSGDIKKLNGMRFAFTDAASTSGYLFAMKKLNEAGVKPGNTVFAMKHDNVITSIYQGAVDAGAAFWAPADSTGRLRDARERVLTQFPDVAQKVKVIAVTDPIPNDPVVFRKGLPEEIKVKITNALVKYAQTPSGRKILESMYSIQGLEACTDQDYTAFRAVVAGMEKEVENSLK